MDILNFSPKKSPCPSQAFSSKKSPLSGSSESGLLNEFQRDLRRVMQIYIQSCKYSSGIVLEKRSGRLCHRISPLFISILRNPGTTAIGRTIRMRSDAIIHPCCLKAYAQNMNPDCSSLYSRMHKTIDEPPLENHEQNKQRSNNQQGRRADISPLGARLEGLSEDGKTNRERTVLH